MTTDWTIRRRVLAGLALACALAAAGGALTLRAALQRGAEDTHLRAAVVRLSALTELVERAGGAGDGARHVVAESAAGSVFSSVRVVAFDGLSLEASTAAADTGERAAPRRLEPGEKPLYDLGQRLRAAVQTNREEGAARKGEIELAKLAGGGWSLAAPVELQDAVSGVVAVELPAWRASAATPWLRALLIYGAVWAVFLVLAFVIGERRWLLIGAAALAFVGGAWAWQARARADVDGAGQRGAQQIVEATTAARIAAERVLRDLALPAEPALAVATWDCDEFRRPRGLVSAAGEIDAAVLARDSDRRATLVGRWTGLGSATSLVLLAFVGLGGAAYLWHTLRRNREAYLYVTPAMLGMLVLVFFPFIYGIALSFTDANLYNSDKSILETWTGLTNFVDILSDYHLVRSTADGWVFNYENFYYTLLFTILWTVSNVAIGVSVGLVLALMLNTKGLALRPAYRVLLILPWAMPNYITALIWRGMFHQQFGVVNQVLQVFGVAPLAWFDRPWSSFAAVLATNGWLSFPFMMVVALGALQSISAELYEAARVDGAGRWQQFRAITLPSLKPALVPAIILSVIWTFNQFNIIYLVSKGDPSSSTEILITQAYKIAFEKYRYGYAAAYSTVIFLLLLVYGTLQNRLTRATENA